MLNIVFHFVSFDSRVEASLHRTHYYNDTVMINECYGCSYQVREVPIFLSDQT